MRRPVTFPAMACFAACMSAWGASPAAGALEFPLGDVTLVNGTQAEVSGTASNETETASCFEVSAAASDERINVIPSISMICLAPHESASLRILVQSQGDPAVGRYFALISLRDGSGVVERQLDITVDPGTAESVSVVTD